MPFDFSVDWSARLSEVLYMSNDAAHAAACVSQRQKAKFFYTDHVTLQGRVQPILNAVKKYPGEFDSRALCNKNAWNAFARGDATSLTCISKIDRTLTAMASSSVAELNELVDLGGGRTISIGRGSVVASLNAAMPESLRHIREIMEISRTKLSMHLFGNDYLYGYLEQGANNAPYCVSNKIVNVFKERITTADGIPNVNGTRLNTALTQMDRLVLFDHSLINAQPLGVSRGNVLK